MLNGDTIVDSYEQLLDTKIQEYIGQGHTMEDAKSLANIFMEKFSQSVLESINDSRENREYDEFAQDSLNHND